MAANKRNPQGSTIDGRAEGMSLEADADESHWRFLEEIDAPMWVDLEAEAQLMVQDSDDAWFYTVHPFHQCSSHYFVSSFSRFDKDNQERPNLSSPNLPGSVSSSRGKHYKKQPWAAATGITSRIHKSPAQNDLFQHPIKLLVGKKSSCISSNDHSTSRGESITKTPGKASKISFERAKITISSCGDTADKSCPRLEISRASRPFSSGSGLLSAVKICLRKSYFTPHASRVEIKNGRHLDQKTSSSSKSSIGSSTITGGDSGSGGLGRSRKERTPQSRMASTTVRSDNVLKKASNLTAIVRAQIPERKPNLNMKARATGTPKVHQTTTSRKPLRPLNSTTALKVKAAIKPTQSMNTLKTSSTNIVKENALKFSNQSKKDAARNSKLKDGKGTFLIKAILQLSPAAIFLCSLFYPDDALLSK